MGLPGDPTPEGANLEPPELIVPELIPGDMRGFFDRHTPLLEELVAALPRNVSVTNPDRRAAYTATMMDIGGVELSGIPLDRRTRRITQSQDYSKRFGDFGKYLSRMAAEQGIEDRSGLEEAVAYFTDNKALQALVIVEAEVWLNQWVALARASSVLLPEMRKLLSSSNDWAESLMNWVFNAEDPDNRDVGLIITLAEDWHANKQESVIATALQLTAESRLARLPRAYLEQLFSESEGSVSVQAQWLNLIRRSLELPEDKEGTRQAIDKVLSLGQWPKDLQGGLDRFERAKEDELKKELERILHVADPKFRLPEGLEGLEKVWIDLMIKMPEAFFAKHIRFVLVPTPVNQK